MDIDEIRRQNISALEAQNGGPANFAKKVGMSQVQYTNLRDGAKDNRTGKRRGMRKETAWRFEDAGGKPRGWLDQDHSDTATPSNADKYVMIPRLTVQAAAGNGLNADHVEIQESLAFRNDWLRKKKLKPAFLQVYTARGDSMSPYIEDGDIILVDTETTTPQSGEVWVIYQPPPVGVRVKRLLFRENEDMIIRSDNADKGMYPDEQVHSSPSSEVQIIGKVVWRGG